MNKLILLVCTALMVGCTANVKENLTESGLKRSNFQTEVNGEKTDLFVLTNKNKMEVCITNFGGRIVSVMVPDKDGTMKDVVLGFDASHWTEWNINCRRITTGTACTVVRKVSSTASSTLFRRATKKCN